MIFKNVYSYVAVMSGLVVFKVEFGDPWGAVKRCKGAHGRLGKKVLQNKINN